MSVKIWTPKDGQCVHTIQGHDFHRAPVVQVAVSKKDAILSGDAEGKLFLSNFDGKLKGELKGHTDSIECIAFSPNLPLAATGSTDGTLRIWDLDTLTCRQMTELGDGVLHLEWHPATQHILVVAGGKVLLYEARTLEQLAEWYGPTSTVNSFHVASDWTRFVTVEDGGPCLVFDPKDSE